MSRRRRVVSIDEAKRALAARDALIVASRGMVERIAREMFVRLNLPPCFTVDDLTGPGKIGLIDAAKKYNPTVGPFPPLARTRIKGEIVESVRRRRWEESTRAPITEQIRAKATTALRSRSDNANAQADQHPARYPDPTRQRPCTRSRTASATTW